MYRKYGKLKEFVYQLYYFSFTVNTASMNTFLFFQVGFYWFLGIGGKSKNYTQNYLCIYNHDIHIYQCIFVFIMLVYLFIISIRPGTIIII